MVEVTVNKDIRKTETKFLGPFTLRQFISVAIASLYAIPLFICLKIDITARIMIPCILAIPVAMCGWIKPFGMHFEFFLAKFLYLTLLTPSKRKVLPGNTYKREYQKLIDRDERRMMAKMSDAKRKAYLEEKKHPKIKRSGKPQYKVFT